MKQIFPVYPDGIAGGGLLLLRVGLGLDIANSMLTTALPYWGLFLLSLSALALLFGLGTRVIALLYAVLCLVLLASDLTRGLFPATQALHALAVTTLGPGAFSVDAMRFGRSKVSSSSRH